MRINEILTEGKNHPVICVDVQPEYSGMNDGDENAVFPEIINFVVNQTGKVLMLINAEETGITGDTIDGVRQYWEDTIRDEEEIDYDDPEYDEYDLPEDQIDWSRFTIHDKGYGYLRSWQSFGISDANIIKTIREMYQQKITDSRELFSGKDSLNYEKEMQEFLGNDYTENILDDPLTVEWISIAQLKKFNGAYIVGGGREECLWEVTTLMSAFNIKYKMIDSLVYG